MKYIFFINVYLGLLRPIVITCNKRNVKMSR